MAEGELRYKAGDVDTGLDHLRAAAYASDHLVYDEPWGWMQPPRHALAALLMEQERFDEAESIYTADLGFNAELPRLASIRPTCGHCTASTNASLGAVIPRRS